MFGQIVNYRGEDALFLPDTQTFISINRRVSPPDLVVTREYVNQHPVKRVVEIPDEVLTRLGRWSSDGDALVEVLDEVVRW